MIAAAAEGSVRDGLSMLDQAIAMANTRARAQPTGLRPPVSASATTGMSTARTMSRAWVVISVCVSNVLRTPGCPEKFWILMPDTRPCSNWSKLGAGIFSMALPDITCTAVVVLRSDWRW